MGIPANVTVRLRIQSRTLTIGDAVLTAAAERLSSLLSSSIDGSTVTGDSEALEVDKSLLNGSIEEAGLKDIKETGSGSELCRRIDFESFQEIVHGELLDRRGLFPFLVRFFGLFLRRMNRTGNIIRIEEPETGEEIIESTGTWSVTRGKSRKNRIEMVRLQGGSPGGKRGNPELHRQDVRPKHVRGKSGVRAEAGIGILQDDIHLGEVEIPEFVDDVPGSGVEGGNGIRVVFTKQSQDMILIGGVSAGIKRFQSVHLQSSVIWFLIEGARLASPGGAGSSRRAAHFVSFVKHFFEKNQKSVQKSGGIQKLGSQKVSIYAALRFREYI